MSNSLLKSLHKYNFSKYPIESVRNRIVNNYSAKSVMSYKTSEPVQSDLITLSARDGKVFGNISKDAYSAISKGTLESYVPKNDNERFVLDEYRKYPTIPLSSSEEDELGTVSYNTYKSLSKGENVSSFYNENEKSAVDNYNSYVKNMNGNVSDLMNNYGLQELIRARYFAGNGGEKPSENSDTYERDLSHWKSSQRHIKELDIAINQIINNYEVADLNETIYMFENILEGHSLEHPGNLPVEKEPYQKADMKCLPPAIEYLKVKRDARLKAHPEETPDNVLVYLGKNAYHSLVKFGVGIRNSTDFAFNLFSSSEDKDKSNSRIKNRSAYIRNRFDDIQRNRPNASAAFNGLISSTGQTAGMIPAAVATYINPAFGTALIAVDSFGNNYGEALVEGATPGEAFAYALSSTAIEVAIERLIGNKLIGGEGILNKKIGKVISRVAKRPATQAAFRFIVDVVGEGGEEIATTAIMPWVKRAIYDPDAELPTAEQIVEAGIGGMVGGAIWSGVDSVTSKRTTQSPTQNVEAVDNSYDVDLAIGNIMDGKATSGDFKFFAPENTSNRNILNESFDVDLAIGNIMDGKANFEDFKLFAPGNTANRQAFYEATGIKLPKNLNLTNYSLMALNNKNRNINNLYLKHIQKPDVDAKTKDFYLKYDNTLKQSDSLTQNGEGGIIKRNSYSVATSRYVNKNDPLFINSKKIPPLPGFEDIVSHGDEYSIVFKDTNGNESNVSAKEFVEFLKQDENYKGGNIRLISCETGKGDGIVPQYIANELGVDVLAPTDLVWVFDDGEMYVAYDMDNALAGINTGEWKLFKPKRK